MNDLECLVCGTRFSVTWSRTPWFNKPEYCPFCGAELEIETPILDTTDRDNDNYCEA